VDISQATVWQQAAGDTNRDYPDLFLRWDVILSGPGDFGPWPERANALRENVIPRKVSDVRRFAEEMEDGDLVVLRRGTSEVLGVGQVVGEYEWRDEFGDVDGWNIQHVRRVRWIWRNSDDPKQFDRFTLKWGTATQKLKPGPVTDWLSSLEIPADAFTRPLVALPPPTQDNEASLDTISEHLFDHGVASSSISTLLDEIGDLVRLAKWYQRSSMPSEYETVAYLVVPLLRALGWTPQRMAVEWNNVDLALFDGLPRSDDTLTVVVEAKMMDKSCLTAKSQATSYASGKSGCQRLIVTDGLRYGVYVRSGLDAFHLYAYMNLTKLRHDYPVLECKGAGDALLAMAPEWGQADPTAETA
jgi:hypothetical protein